MSRTSAAKCYTDWGSTGRLTNGPQALFYMQFCFPINVLGQTHVSAKSRATLRTAFRTDLHSRTVQGDGSQGSSPSNASVMLGHHTSSPDSGTRAAGGNHDRATRPPEFRIMHHNTGQANPGHDEVPRHQRGLQRTTLRRNRNHGARVCFRLTVPISLSSIHPPV